MAVIAGVVSARNDLNNSLYEGERTVCTTKTHWIVRWGTLYFASWAFATSLVINAFAIGALVAVFMNYIQEINSLALPTIAAILAISTFPFQMARTQPEADRAKLAHDIGTLMFATGIPMITWYAAFWPIYHDPNFLSPGWRQFLTEWLATLFFAQLLLWSFCLTLFCWCIARWSHKDCITTFKRHKNQEEQKKR